MFKPFQNFQSKLLAEIYESPLWADFLQTGLTESEKSSTLSTILRSERYEGVSDISEAKAWVSKVRGFFQIIESLSKSCSRNRGKDITKWVSFCEKTISTFKVSPNKKLYDLIERQSNHSKTLLDAAKRGKSVEGLSRELYSMLNKSMNSQGIRMIESLVDHSKFVRELEKEFDVKAVRYEPIRDGVFIYFNREDTKKMNDVVANYNSYIQRIADAFGYLLLRKGSFSEIEYGSFGDDASCWMFVYAPLTPTQKDDEGEVLLTKDFKPLNLSERWGL